MHTSRRPECVHKHKTDHGHWYAPYACRVAAVPSVAKYSACQDKEVLLSLCLRLWPRNCERKRHGSQPVWGGAWKYIATVSEPGAETAAMLFYTYGEGCPPSLWQMSEFPCNVLEFEAGYSTVSPRALSPAAKQVDIHTHAPLALAASTAVSAVRCPPSAVCHPLSTVCRLPSAVCRLHRRVNLPAHHGSRGC